MPGSKKRTTEATLKELVQKHWPDYTIVGSRPYVKGAKMFRKSDHAKVEVFPSNDAAFLILTDAIGTDWFPGKVMDNPIFKQSEISKYDAKQEIARANREYYNSVKRAKDLRLIADEEFKMINMNPLDGQWKRKINKILNTRKPL